MKINFLDFWGGFDPQNNFLLYLFREIYGEVELAPLSQCDVVIYACFGDNHRYVDRSKTKKIFYTGENIRPNFNDCDNSITFDFDDYNGRNVRIPLYFFYIDWFNVKTYTNPEYLLPANQIEDNDFIKTPKTKFCATIFSNPVPIRMRLLNAISQYKPVDGYGRPFNNHFEGEHKKYKILSEYKFSICPENSSHDGYYTEKLFHAKTAGAIPIYMADSGLDRDFNTKSFINIADFENEQRLKEFVIEMDNNDSMYQEMFNEPLFKTPLSLDNIKKAIKEII